MTKAAITRAETLELYRLKDALSVANAAAEQAKKDLDAHKAALRDRVPLSEDPDERAEGVRAGIFHGLQIRIKPTTGADAFRLKGYRDAGGRVTKLMQRFISDGSTYDTWTIEAAPGSSLRFLAAAKAAGRAGMSVSDASGRRSRASSRS